MLGGCFGVAELWRGCAAVAVGGVSGGCGCGALVGDGVKDGCGCCVMVSNFALSSTSLTYFSQNGQSWTRSEIGWPQLGAGMLGGCCGGGGVSTSVLSGVPYLLLSVCFGS